MPGSHPPGSKIFAAHFPDEEARQIEWVHESNQAKVPTKITVAAVIRMLVCEGLLKHVPADVAERIKEEVRLKRQERKNGKQKKPVEEAGGGMGR
jgi:hypothetical protein